MIAGGGIGAVLVALLIAFVGNQTGVDLSALTGGDGSDSGAYGDGQQEYIDTCTAEQANTTRECPVNGTVQPLDAYWTEALPQQAGVEYALPEVVSFTGQVSTGVARRRAPSGRSTARPTRRCTSTSASTTT